MPTDLPFKVKKPGDAAGRQGRRRRRSNATWNIQIGAYPTKQAAQDALYKARKVSPKLFGSKQAFTVEVKKGDETVFRARMSGFNAKTAKRAPARRSRGARSSAACARFRTRRCLEQHVLGLIDLGGEIVRAAVIGMELLHQPAVRGADFIGRRALLQAQHGQRLGPAHRA